MFVRNRTIRHRVHQVPHGLGKGRGSDIEMMKQLNRNIRGGDDSNRMNRDRGSGREKIGTHGVKVHGPELARPCLKMTEARGRHIDRVAARELHPGGSVRSKIITITRIQVPGVVVRFEGVTFENEFLFFVYACRPRGG